MHVNVTAHPTAEWTAQQIVEAFPGETAPGFLIRDRDGINGDRHLLRVLHEFVAYDNKHRPHSSLNGKLRDELLEREIFFTLKEAQVMTEWWRQVYNTIRPHSSLGYRPPAPGKRRPARAPSSPITRTRRAAGDRGASPMPA